MYSFTLQPREYSFNPISLKFSSLWTLDVEMLHTVGIMQIFCTNNSFLALLSNISPNLNSNKWKCPISILRMVENAIALNISSDASLEILENSYDLIWWIRKFALLSSPNHSLSLFSNSSLPILIINEVASSSTYHKFSGRVCGAVHFSVCHWWL